MTKRKKRELSGRLEVEGYPLRWSLKSEQIWSPKGDHLGLRLSVERQDGSHRELILEYPFRGGGRITRPEIDRDRLGQDIRHAMDSGWNPRSRGRPFHFLLRPASDA